MAYKVSWMTDSVLVTLTGFMNSETLMMMVNELASHYRYDEIRKRIYDCHGLTAHSLTLYDIKLYAHIDNAAYMTNPNAHIAIVGGEDVFDGEFDMYKNRLLHKGWQMIRCQSVAEALSWRPITAAAKFQALDLLPSR